MPRSHCIPLKYPVDIDTPYVGLGVTLGVGVTENQYDTFLRLESMAMWLFEEPIALLLLNQGGMT